MNSRTHKEPKELTGRVPSGIPSGVQAFLGPEVELRRFIRARLEDCFSGWGYQEIILPLYDFLETFSAAAGHDLAEKTCRFVDRDGAVLALRPDLTTLVAKIVATRLGNPSEPVRLHYRGEIFRYEPARAGQQRVFAQIGLELLGSPVLASDVEVLLIVDECLRSLGLREYRIAAGHAAFFHGICAGLGLGADGIALLKSAVDRKDVTDLERLVAPFNLSAEKKSFLLALPHMAGGSEILRAARAVVRNAESRRALDELTYIHEIFAGVGRASSLVFDLSEVRDLDYYTGLIFKVYSPALGFAIGGGGRYDRLLRAFGVDLPAIGFSFSEDRLASALVGGGVDFPASPDIQRLSLPGTPAAADFSRVLDLRARGTRLSLQPGSGGCK